MSLYFFNTEPYFTYIRTLRGTVHSSSSTGFVTNIAQNKNRNTHSQTKGTMTKTNDNKFSSDGFDLDALTDAEAGDDIVFEIGGKVSVDKKKSEDDNEEEEDAIAKSEEHKALGNGQFKKGNYLEAYDHYTDAIKACPGISGKEIMKLKEEHDRKEREKMYENHRNQTEFRRGNNNNASQETTTTTKQEDNNNTTTKNNESNNNDKNEFKVPTNKFASKLSVYHSNRAACLLYLEQEEDAIEDCNIAIILNPTYVKALIRRMTAHERQGETEEALKDAKEALKYESHNFEIRKHVQRLQKKEDERLEKLKEETMSKLKDLGNSILGNFGLSLDNFNAQKDPNTGSYNISFQNNNS